MTRCASISLMALCFPPSANASCCRSKRHEPCSRSEPAYPNSRLGAQEPCARCSSPHTHLFHVRNAVLDLKQINSRVVTLDYLILAHDLWLWKYKVSRKEPYPSFY